MSRFTAMPAINDAVAPARVPDSLLGRLRQIPSRFTSIRRHA